MLEEAAALTLLESILSQDLKRVIIDRFLENLIASLAFIFMALFVVGYLLPKLWIHLERILWKILLGGSPDSQWVINYAVKDYQLLLEEKELDEGAPRTLSAFLSVFIRIRQLPRLYVDLKRMQDGRVEDMFRDAINKLNDGWRQGTPAELLKRYIIIIEEIGKRDKIADKRERLRGLCSVALVKYALGNLKEGNELAITNWDDADKLPEKQVAEGKWMAAYALFNSTMFLGQFETAMGRMTQQWSGEYADLPQKQQEDLIASLSNTNTSITLNPVLTLPRHIILASAFNDGPGLKGDDKWQHKWPSAKAFAKLSAKERECEDKWCDAWYKVAQDICASEPISLNFSHAYVGFYFTLLLHEEKIQDDSTERIQSLEQRIQEAFNQITDPAPIVSQYVKYGFSGVYHLVCKRYAEALKNMRLAAVSASISGNGFAECIFMACHALAAAKDEPAVETEINYYLNKTEKLANTIGGDFYPALSAAAFAAVSELRGLEGKANRYKLRAQQARKGRRILRIFLPEL